LAVTYVHPTGVACGHRSSKPNSPSFTETQQPLSTQSQQMLLSSKREKQILPSSDTQT
jgi:hypothetical protein